MNKNLLAAILSILIVGFFIVVGWLFGPEAAVMVLLCMMVTAAVYVIIRFFLEFYIK